MKPGVLTPKWFSIEKHQIITVPLFSLAEENFSLFLEPRPLFFIISDSKHGKLSLHRLGNSSYTELGGYTLLDENDNSPEKFDRVSDTNFRVQPLVTILKNWENVSNPGKLYRVTKV